MNHDLKVGDILVSSWGYDQTNIDFYEVTRLAGETMVEVRRIASEIDHAAAGGTMNYMVPVVPVRYVDFMKRRKVYENRVSISSYAGAVLWDGKPKGETGAGFGH